MKLNLGCGDRTIEGYVSVDIAQPADVVTDLAQPWPWAESSISDIKAFDIAEHIEDRIHFMNEAWRVLKAHGTMEIEVPSASHGAGFAQDPTHRSAWCLNSFQYFENDSPAHKRFAASYSIRARFKVAHLSETRYEDRYEPVWKVHAKLVAVK